MSIDEKELKKAASYFGKQGGAKRKAQNPDYSNLGKLGNAKRWSGHKKKDETKHK